MAALQVPETSQRACLPKHDKDEREFTIKNVPLSAKLPHVWARKRRMVGSARTFDNNGAKLSFFSCWYHVHFFFLLVSFIRFPSYLFLSQLAYGMCAWLGASLFVPPLVCDTRLEMQAIGREAPSYLVVSIFHYSFMGSQTEGDISPPFKAKMLTPRSVILFCYRSSSVFCFACLYILCTRSCLPFLSTLFTCPFLLLLLSLRDLPELEEAHHACEADGAHHAGHHHRAEGGREDPMFLVQLVLKREE